MEKKIAVLVTGVGGGGHGEQILKALRMAETPYEIVGCDMSPYSKGLKDVDHPYLVPSASDPSYLEVLFDICRKHQVRALFHGSEPELLIMSRRRNEILAQNLFLPINPPNVIDTCMNKLSTFRFLSDHGFIHPQTESLRTLEDVEKWSSFPAILKPSIGSGGSAHTFIVQDKTELEMLARYILDSKACSEIIIQEYKGTAETEFTVGVLFDMDGNFINSIAIRRNLRSALSVRIRVPNRTGKDEFGPYLTVSSGVSQGEIGRFPEVTGPCERIASAIGTRGAINLQCRVHNGEVHVFEINPRFSGTTSLRAMAGYNEPDILIRKHLLGESIIERFSYKEAVIVRGLEETLLDEAFATSLVKPAIASDHVA